VTSAPAARMRSVRAAGVMVPLTSTMTPEHLVMIVLVLVAALWAGMHSSPYCGPEVSPRSEAKANVCN